MRAYTDSIAGDVLKYSRGPIAVALFTEFPGRNTPVASEGAEWRAARKTMAYVGCLESLAALLLSTRPRRPIFTIKSFTNHVSSAMNEVRDQAS